MFKKLLRPLLLALTSLLTLTSLPCLAELRDPTRPAYQIIPGTTVDKVNEADESPLLSGIWISATSRWVALNGIYAKQGQSIAGNINIIKIRKNEVTINQNGTIKTLQLLQSPYRNR